MRTSARRQLEGADPSVACPLCEGALHVRIPGTESFRRCSCLRAVLSREFIKPLIRGNDPEPLPDTPVLPLADTVMLGALQSFHQQVWHSLLVYEPQGLVYEYLPAYRIPLIHFQQDDGFPSMLPLQEVRLLVLVGGVEIKNSFLGPLTLQTLTVRRQAGLPTWVHMASFDRVQEFYGTEVLHYLRDLRVLEPAATQPQKRLDRSKQALATGTGR